MTAVLDTTGAKRNKTWSLFLRSSHLMGQTDPTYEKINIGSVRVQSQQGACRKQLLHMEVWGKGFMVVTSELLSDVESGAGRQQRVCMVF